MLSDDVISDFKLINYRNNINPVGGAILTGHMTYFTGSDVNYAFGVEDKLTYVPEFPLEYFSAGQHVR